MADSKISALPASTTPLAGTEVLPIVQSSTTKQVSVANLTAGRAISASTVTATTTMGVGAATPAASGAGITFPAAQSASTDANTLDDYEEGTWTPNVGGTATYTLQNGSYIKVGRLVTVSFDMEILLILTGDIAEMKGLPFVVGSATAPKQEQCVGAAGYFASLGVNVYALSFYAAANRQVVYAISTSALGATANANPNIYGNGTKVQGTITYMAAS